MGWKVYRTSETIAYIRQSRKRHPNNETIVVPTRYGKILQLIDVDGTQSYTKL